MILHVTSADIHDGFRGLCSLCPIAVAYTRQAGHTCDVTHVLRDLGSDASFKLPEAAHRFIFAFDAGEPVEPFSLELQPIPPRGNPTLGNEYSQRFLELRDMWRHARELEAVPL